MRTDKVRSRRKLKHQIYLIISYSVVAVIDIITVSGLAFEGGEILTASDSVHSVLQPGKVLSQTH